MCVKSLEAFVTNFEILLLFFEHMYNHKLHETMMKIQIRDLMFSQFDGKRLICEIISTNVKYRTYSNMS